MVDPTLAFSIAQGVAELIKVGIVAVEHRQEAEGILIKNMKMTPSSKEPDEYEAHQQEAESLLESMLDTEPTPDSPPRKPDNK